MDISLRVAVNARALEWHASPLARGTASHLIKEIAGLEDLHLDLIAAEPIPASLSGGAPSHVVPLSRAPSSVAIFDQLQFPRAARDLGADLLLYLHASAPIAAPAPAVSWYGDGETEGAMAGPEGRIVRSLAQAGLRGAGAVLRPLDLPAEAGNLAWVAVPPSVPSVFFPGETAPTDFAPQELPGSFVLAACESTGTLTLLLAAWTWVEGSLGDSHVLLLGCGDEPARIVLQRRVDQAGLSATVRAVIFCDDDWPSAFHAAAALLHGGERQNATALRWALAGNLPVAGLATPISRSIVGPAGYLVEQREARALGAACLTLLVEEEMAASLREQGRERAKSYRREVAVPAWAEALRRVARATTGRARRSRSTRLR